MKSKLLIICFTLASSIFFFSQCSDIGKDNQTLQKQAFGGFDIQVKWGEHLVLIMGCSDCHTPKKITPKGPVLDESLMLSGHPAQMPPPDVDRKEMESKGLGVTQTLTAWVGRGEFHMRRILSLMQQGSAAGKKLVSFQL